jgi:uncharacterized protein YlxP (DUF503 family)
VIIGWPFDVSELWSGDAVNWIVVGLVTVCADTRESDDADRAIANPITPA